jgi:hypothetical protein
MVSRIGRPLKIVAFNTNDIWRRRYELSKQLQDLYIRVDIALLSEIHRKTHEWFFIPNYRFCRAERFPGRKDIHRSDVNALYMCDTYT